MDIDKGDIEWLISWLTTMWAVAVTIKPQKENSPQKRKRRPKQKRK